MTTILAIDPGRRAGVARLDLDTGAIVAREVDWADDPPRMTAQIAAAVGLDAPVMVAIEDQHLGLGRWSSIALAQMAGACAWWCRERWPDVTVVWLHPAAARSLAQCGQRKADVPSWIDDLAGAGYCLDAPDDGRSDNAYDAVVLAVAGARIWRHNGGLV